MKTATLVILITLALVLYADAQTIELTSIDRNGSITALGVRPGTTATVEWAASLSEPGRTNWHALSQFVATEEIMTTDIPMFFRVVGTPETNLPSGLVAYYPFNGTANDESGNGHHGVVSGTLGLATNRFGETDRAYYCDGVPGSFVDTGVSLNLQDTAISISLWTYLPFEGGQGAPLFGHGGPTESTLDNLEIHRSAPDSYYFIAMGGSGSYAQSGHVPTGQWVHLVAVAQYAPTVVHRLYVNGAVYDGGSEGVASTLKSMFIGSSNGRGTSFHGIIDDVRIYSTALTPIDVWKLQHITAE